MASRPCRRRPHRQVRRQPRPRPPSRSRSRSICSRRQATSRSRCGRQRRCSTTRRTSTSTRTAASGSPRAFATAGTTPASPKAIASSCCRTRDGDGKADSTHTFVQEPALVAPLGVSVIDNKIVVSQPPDLIVYTDVDRNLRFDPAVDKREVLLTGFHGVNHDHSLHSVTVGPDGKWVFNSGNTGAMFTDRSGKTFRSFGAYRDGPVGPFKDPHNKADHAGKPSDDGHVYVGGFTVRMNPDGTNAEIIGHNYRNSYEQSVTSLGDVFQNDNDDPPACRVAWVMEYANFGFSSTRRAAVVAGGPASGADGADRRMAAGRSGHGAGRRRLRRRIADRQRLLRERRARRGLGRHVLRRRAGAQRDLRAISPKRSGAGFDLRAEDLPDVEPRAAVRRIGLHRRQPDGEGAVETLFRPSDVAIGPDGALYISDWIDPRVGGHTDLDDTTVGCDLPHCAEGIRLEVAGVRPGDDRGADHGAALAGGQRARDRLRRAEGARRVGRDAVAALLSDPNPFMRGRALYLLYQLGPEGRQRAGTPESQKDPAMKIAAYRAMRRAGLDVLPVGGAARARSRRRRAARGRALAARSSGRRSLDILVDIARGFDGQGSHLPRGVRHGRDEQGSRALRSAARDSPRRQRSGRLVARLRPDRVAAAPAGGRRGSAGARARRSCRPTIASSRSTRSRSSTIRPPRTRC